MLSHATQRLTKIPDFLITAANDLKAEATQKRVAEFNETQRKMVRSGKVSCRWASSNMPMIDHGFGVLENESTGAVWHVDGEFLIRQDSDEDIEAIIASI